MLNRLRAGLRPAHEPSGVHIYAPAVHSIGAITAGIEGTAGQDWAGGKLNAEVCSVADFVAKLVDLDAGAVELDLVLPVVTGGYGGGEDANQKLLLTSRGAWLAIRGSIPSTLEIPSPVDHQRRRVGGHILR